MHAPSTPDGDGYKQWVFFLSLSHAIFLPQFQTMHQLRPNPFLIHSFIHSDPIPPLPFDPQAIHPSPPNPPHRPPPPTKQPLVPIAATPRHRGRDGPPLFPQPHPVSLRWVRDGIGGAERVAGKGGGPEGVGWSCWRCGAADDGA